MLLAGASAFARNIQQLRVYVSAELFSVICYFNGLNVVIAERMCALFYAHICGSNNICMKLSLKYMYLLTQIGNCIHNTKCRVARILIDCSRCAHQHTQNQQLSNKFTVTANALAILAASALTDLYCYVCFFHSYFSSGSYSIFDKIRMLSPVYRHSHTNQTIDQ